MDTEQQSYLFYVFIVECIVFFNSLKYTNYFFAEEGWGKGNGRKNDFFNFSPPKPNHHYLFVGPHESLIDLIYINC